MTLSGAAILIHNVETFALQVVVLLAFAGFVGVLLARLGYLVTLWNSQGIVWLRRRFTFMPPAKPLDPGSDPRDGA
jgi:hypothetical protein